MLDQKRSRLARASSGPSLARPEASRTALMAPALAPLTASNSRSSSSRRRSSTPQVNAPKAPPPCSPILRDRAVCTHHGLDHARSRLAVRVLLHGGDRLHPRRGLVQG